jgi:hypothetical protein
MPVDYDKLATEHGGSSVDYDSLASQHGGIISNTPGQILAPPPKGPNSLPDQLPNEMLRLGVNSLPAIGAVMAGPFAPAAAIPAMLYAAGGGMIGSAAKQGIQLATKDPEAPKSVGEFGKNVAIDGTVNGVSEGTGRLINVALSKTLGRVFNPTEAYQSALRPPPASTSIQKAEKLVGTGLKEGIPVSKSGYEEAIRQSKDIDKNIEDILQKGVAPGAGKTTVDPKAIVAPLQKLRNRIMQGTGDQGAINAIDRVEANFLKAHPTDMTPMEAHGTKKALYEELRRSNMNAWDGGAKPNPIDDEAIKDLSQATLQEILQIHPELKELGARQGGLIELQQAIGRRLNVENNKTGLPYFALLGAAGLGGSHVGGAEGAGGGIAAAHVLHKVMEDPNIKSWIAIQLAKAGRTKAGAAIAKALPYAAPTAVKLGAQALRNTMLKPPPNVDIPRTN